MTTLREELVYVRWSLWLVAAAVVLLAGVMCGIADRRDHRGPAAPPAPAAAVMRLVRS